jgi:hypothetical protein
MLSDTQSNGDSLHTTLVDRVDLTRRLRIEMHVWDEEQVRLFLGGGRRSSPH